MTIKTKNAGGFRHWLLVSRWWVFALHHNSKTCASTKKGWWFETVKRSETIL